MILHRIDAWRKIWLSQQFTTRRNNAQKIPSRWTQPWVSRRRFRRNRKTCQKHLKLPMHFEYTTRVDVSETFSADQLWFRILSGLFQRCSLPENLWTALIQLWTALKTEIFRAKNQRWNSAVQLWNRAVSEQFRAVFLWFSAVQRWSKFVTFWSEIVKIH